LGLDVDICIPDPGLIGVMMHNPIRQSGHSTIPSGREQSADVQRRTHRRRMYMCTYIIVCHAYVRQCKDTLCAGQIQAVDATVTATIGANMCFLADLNAWFR
jgi:hypothetical protein